MEHENQSGAAGSKAAGDELRPITDRECRRLRGPVRTCIEDIVYLHAVATSSPQNSLPASTSRTEFDQTGQLAGVRSLFRKRSPVIQYDNAGRKMKIQVSSRDDYMPNTSAGGSPFGIADRPPNLPDGGTATTLFDGRDRPVEVEVRDAQGILVSRAARIYDLAGRVAEEELQYIDFVPVFPRELRAKVEMGIEEIRADFAKVMAGSGRVYAETYVYDAEGRIVRTTRRIFGRQEIIDTTYNGHGDVESEVKRSHNIEAQELDEPEYTETRYSYQYDETGNWIERIAECRHDPESAFEPSFKNRRELIYF